MENLKVNRVYIFSQIVGDESLGYGRFVKKERRYLYFKPLHNPKELRKDESGLVKFLNIGDFHLKT